LSHKSKSKPINNINGYEHLKAKYILGNYQPSRLIKKNNKIISNPNLMKSSESKYKNIEMGIVGEPIIGSSSRIGVLRKEARRAGHKGSFTVLHLVTSLDSHLPKIRESLPRDHSECTTDRQLKLPVLGNKSSKRLIEVYGVNNKMKHNIRYKPHVGKLIRITFSVGKESKSVNRSYVNNYKSKKYRLNKGTKLLR
jgi:hypothetical protein